MTKTSFQHLNVIISESNLNSYIKFIRGLEKMILVDNYTKEPPYDFIHPCDTCINRFTFSACVGCKHWI